jgi:hypothetical protein
VCVYVPVPAIVSLACARVSTVDSRRPSLHSLRLTSLDLTLQVLTGEHNANTTQHDAIVLCCVVFVFVLCKSISVVLGGTKLSSQVRALYYEWIDLIV